MAAFHAGPAPGEAARATESPEALWGRTSTAPASASRVRVPLVPEHHDGIGPRTLAGSPDGACPGAAMARGPGAVPGRVAGVFPEAGASGCRSV
ncbi:hypothetical protein ACWEN3_34635 [Streptomyces sp. NPDC004561]